MSDEKHKQEGEDTDLVTREYLNLRLAGFRSEMRLLFVVAVAGNTLLSHLQINPVAGYLGSGVALVGALAMKIFFLR